MYANIIYCLLIFLTFIVLISHSSFPLLAPLVTQSAPSSAVLSLKLKVARTSKANLGKTLDSAMANLEL